MELTKLLEKLKLISSMGFIKSMRRDNTGIGYTLETLLEIRENNIRTPDLGDIELKSKRKRSNSMITMFTFNSGIWKLKPLEVIRRYGYKDKKGRYALKCTLSTVANAQGLFLQVTESDLFLKSNINEVIAVWRGENLMNYFDRKIPAMLLVLADSRIADDNSEEFFYNEAYLLSSPSKKGLLKLIETGLMFVDLRMHINENGNVRNRGTAFRVFENSLIECFEKRIKLI